MSPEHFAAQLALGQKLTDVVLRPMKESFVGKDEIIDLLGICLVAGENLFLLGPPGTAKSALVQQLGKRIDGNVFDYLLTRFTEPNELFGPFDIRKLREGELITNTEGMLPEAAFVFLDELLNANSAILNSLLMVLNERRFRRGRESRQLPTLMVVGASNRLPEDDALGALFDRFLLRVPCENVEVEQLPHVLLAGWKLDVGGDSDVTAMSVDEVRSLQNLLPQVDLTPIASQYVALIHRLRHAGISISDRRAVKLQRLIAASAIVCGRLKVDRSDLWVLRYIWDTQEQQEVLRSLVEDALTPSELRAAEQHPRSRGNQRPDPEELSRDLDRLAEKLADPKTTDNDRSFVRDQLSLLASRFQWVEGETQRKFLEGKMKELWGKAGVAT